MTCLKICFHISPLKTDGGEKGLIYDQRNLELGDGAKNKTVPESVFGSPGSK